MITRIRKAMQEKDRGFTLIELLVVVIIIGILAAIAIPLYMNQKAKAFDATVKADLKNFATAAETNFTALNKYTDDADNFGTPTITKSDNNTFVAWVDEAGGDAGYVIVGKNKNSSELWVLSSYDGSKPKSLGTGTALPTALPDLTVTGAPTTAEFDTAGGVTF